jgi:hypothetical protein
MCKEGTATWQPGKDTRVRQYYSTHADLRQEKEANSQAGIYTKGNEMETKSDGMNEYSVAKLRYRPTWKVPKPQSCNLL